MVNDGEYSLLAQLVEQQTFNLWVAGSNPAEGTKSVRHTSAKSYFILRRRLLVQVQPPEPRKLRCSSIGRATKISLHGYWCLTDLFDFLSDTLQ